MHPGTDVAAALAHHNAGRLHEAERGYRAILREQPRHADALHLLGLVSHQTGNDHTAATLIRQAIAITPRNARYHANLGVVLLRQRRARDAASALRTALRLRPADFGSQANLAVALSALGDHAGAVKAAGAALRLRPGDPATLCNRSQFLEKIGQYDMALAAVDAAIQVDPNSYTAHLARGNLLLAMGRITDALVAFDTAISLQTSDQRAAHARIVAMNYLPGTTMAEIGGIARRLAPRFNGQSAMAFAERNRSPDRQLRIGYVSADFRNHPVSYFLQGVMAAHDKIDAVVTCYDNGLAADAMTDALKAEADHWRPISDLDDDEATEAIRADGIDVLVDLAGHTQGNRLGVFARRAAPVQVAWLGYFGTTGLTEMDFILADDHVLPPSAEATVTERVVRLPGSYLCFTPPVEAGSVAPLPGGMVRPITFGCFNNRAKLNDDVLTVWSRVLAAVPGSRLLLKSTQYTDKSICREIIHAFAASGIQSERLLFEGFDPIVTMFSAYGKVDIALDPFPFAGGATTAQALWMGVPVVSLVGETWPGRQGASLLSAAGFPEWVADNADDYVALACRLAMNRPVLANLRSSMRQKIIASPLCRADHFVKHLHRAYRNMWHSYLAGV